MSDMAKAMEDSLPDFPPIDSADPGILWIILTVCKACLEQGDMDDKVQALRVATVTKVALVEWIKLASEEVGNVQRH